MLNAIGPYEILRNLKGVNIKFVAKEKGEIIADSQMVHLNAKYDIKEVTKADVLLIPESLISFVKEMKDDKVLQWIRDIDSTTQKTVGYVALQRKLLLVIKRLHRITIKLLP